MFSVISCCVVCSEDILDISLALVGCIDVCYLVEIDTDLDLAVGPRINIRFLCADNMLTMRVD